MPRSTHADQGSLRSLPYTGRVTDTIDSHTGTSGGTSPGGSSTEAGVGPGPGSTARTAAARPEQPESPYPIPAAVPRAGALPTPSEQARAAKDKTLTSPVAVELARHALEEVTDSITVGEYLAVVPNNERLVTHLFDCTLSGYRGWRWAVTLSRVPRSRTATVCEMELLPGEESLLAPAWVPWADRLEPGDVTRSDRLPRKETDERLEPGWEAAGEDADDVALDQVGLGRPRVLSSQGMSSAAERWYGGDHGPDAEGVRKAHATCSTCGFFLPMAGALRAIFGVCANEWATDDGSVVSLDHGCGAHSETDLPDQGPEWPINPSRVDDHLMVPLSTNGLDLREGRTIAELVAQLPGGDVGNSEDGADIESDDTITQSASGAPGPGSDAGASVRGTDSRADAANSVVESDDAADGLAVTGGAPDTGSAVDGTNAAPATEEQVEYTSRKPAAKRARRATSSARRRRRTADLPDETAEAHRSRVPDLDLGDLGDLARTEATSPSASLTPDTASTTEPTAPVSAAEASSAPDSAGSGDTPGERAASARAAVAGLSLALGIDIPQDDEPSADTENADTDTDAHHAPRTLAELEAILPNRS